MNSFVYTFDSTVLLPLSLQLNNDKHSRSRSQNGSERGCSYVGASERVEGGLIKRYLL